MGLWWEVPFPASPQSHINLSFRGQLIGQLFGHHIQEFVKTCSMHLGRLITLVASFGLNSPNTHITHNMPQPPTHSFSKVFPNIKWMVVPLTLGTSCAFTHTIPFLDGILTSLLCPSMSTLLHVMNSIPKMQSIPPKVETNKSTLPLQFPN